MRDAIITTILTVIVLGITPFATTTLDMPGTFSTYTYGIDDSHIVGYYDGDYGNAHGFIYTTPEPASLFLFGGWFLGFIGPERKKS
jgi:hypothetical protein